jgi:hypothetical protein
MWLISIFNISNLQASQYKFKAHQKFFRSNNFKAGYVQPLSASCSLQIAANHEAIYQFVSSLESPQADYQ